jgi:hypothetical protein
MKSWVQTITPLLNKQEKETNKLFASFEKEKTSKKLKTTAEENSLWRSKYASKLKDIEAKHEKEYNIIWKKFHSK